MSSVAAVLTAPPPHFTGELGVEEGGRRLVPVSVWAILAKYFPEAQPYHRDQTLCPQCTVSAFTEQMAVDVVDGVESSALD